MEDYIDELFQDEKLKNREILTTRESLVTLSGLGALIDKMLESREFNQLSPTYNFTPNNLMKKVS